MRNDITGLGIEPAEGTLKVGAALQLNLFAKSGRGRVELVPGNAAAWSSSDSRVGEVTRQGRLSARRAGSVTVTASYGGSTVEATFTVVD